MRPMLGLEPAGGVRAIRSARWIAKVCFAIDHAATAPIIKRRYPSVPDAPPRPCPGHGAGVGGVQLSWHERTTKKPPSVASRHPPPTCPIRTGRHCGRRRVLADDHRKGLAARLGRAVGLGIVSHCPESLHGARHRALARIGDTEAGAGSLRAADGYLTIEVVYGILVGVYRGSIGLPAVISIGNLANLFFSPPLFPAGAMVARCSSYADLRANRRL